MGINKVNYGSTTLIDISNDTVTAGSMLSGTTAHDNSGAAITGSIESKSSSDLTASGATVTAPAGYYASSASKAVSSGSATAPATITGSSATVSAGTNTLTLSKTVSVTPDVTAGYVSSGEAGNSSVSLTASVTTKAAATITPGTTNQTISAGTYLTGKQTIAGDANLIAANIASGVSIFGVAGSLANGYKTTTSAATSSQTILSFVLTKEPSWFIVVCTNQYSTVEQSLTATRNKRYLMGMLYDGSTTKGFYLATGGTYSSWYTGSMTMGYSYNSSNKILTINVNNYNFAYTLIPSGSSNKSVYSIFYA